MEMPSLNRSMAPLQEYLLQGSILDKHRGPFLHRLNGLCDVVSEMPEKFHDHEMVYHLKGVGVQPMVFRVRRALDHPDSPWHVRYVGQPEIGDKTRQTLVRSYIDVGTSDNISLFLTEMGFKQDHEYVAKGYIFRKGRMKIVVSKIYRMPHQGNTETLDVVSESHVVELSVLAPHGQDQVQEDMKNFAEQLKPLIQLEKIDHKRLQ
ncbi:hypothetical protein NP493_78g07038 [Ridgeia piscesae]|uniref:Mediator of RNA polymerase II transcription subunit 18 n=1 Tax=Ridgeia piscesae TaxID=27915 RepID=A0AAD9P9A7_RIDPI|nr:hypothetical protein NP493_78g07038 [Ridgeia piscesae]